MTINEAKNELNKIDNEIEYYNSLKELGTSQTISSSLQDLCKRKLIHEEFIRNEILRLKKYDEPVQLIIYYKEQCADKYTWKEISLKTHYSVAQCKRIYKKWKQAQDDTL